MLIAFLIGLAVALVAAIVVLAIKLVSGKWLHELIADKLKNKKNHKVAFADTKEVVDEYMKNKVDDSEEISMDELERMCEETPFVSAMVDEDGNITDYEGYKAEQYDKNFQARMKQQKGMIVCGV